MNRRFEKIDYVDLADQTCEVIRKQILTRELASNAQVHVETIAAQLGVSRTPVLDALKKLANEGLVEIRPRRGCYVKPLLVEDVREIFEAREAVELFCTRSVIERGKGRALAKGLAPLMRAMERQIRGDEFLDYEAFTAADRSFHDLVVNAVGNMRLSRVYANLNVHMHVMRVHLFQELELPGRVMAAHAAIQKAFANGDRAAAEAATIAHLGAISLKMNEHLVRAGGSI